MIEVLKIVHDRNSTFVSAILTVIGEAMFGWNRETSLTLEQQQDSSCPIALRAFNWLDFVWNEDVNAAGPECGSSMYSDFTDELTEQDQEDLIDFVWNLTCQGTKDTVDALELVICWRMQSK